jgi:transposase
MRRSIPPQKLLRALLLQILYSLRSERLLMEELEYSILYRWFVGLGMDGRLVRRDVWPALSPSENSMRRPWNSAG